MSVAFAPKDALEGEFVNTSREAFRVAQDVSAYSLVALARAAAEHETDGGSVCRDELLWRGKGLVPHYNVMGVAKAALEASTRYLAHDLGPKKIRVTWAGLHPGRARHCWVYRDAGRLRSQVTAESECPA